jgi:circadian clock protein KaiB
MNTKPIFRFLLFVSGESLISKKAIFNCKKNLDIILKSKYELEIINVFENPKLAVEENIIALPILIRKIPIPEVRIIGDMSNLELFKSDLLLN